MVFILKKPDQEKKIAILGRAARDDACASSWSEQSPPRKGRKSSLPPHFRSTIHTSLLPGGRSIKLFKILLDSHCEMDCRYCALRSSGAGERCRMEPEELARTFIDLYRRRLVGGIFLSSAIPGPPERTQERMIQTAQILRRRHDYRGYLHLKILPGVSEEAVRQSCRWADRVSVNLEAPNQKRLDIIAPRKNIREGVIRRLAWAADEAQKEENVPAGITTQFVVGAAGESDREILISSAWLYRHLKLRRAYYSALRPVPGTPLENVPPPLPQREHRLYQADWLLRFYGFRFEELPFKPGGELPLEIDPKLAWAKIHPEFFPVEINQASREELLRVPGIGKISAEKVLSLRRGGKISSLQVLRKLRIPPQRSRNFITVGGKFYPVPEKSPGKETHQLMLDL